MTNPFDSSLTEERAQVILTGKELALFHAYNPNGVMAEWKALDDKLVNLGRGFLAYGSVGYLNQQMTELSSHNRKRVSKRDLKTIVKMIRFTIERGYEFIDQSTQETV